MPTCNTENPNHPTQGALNVSNHNNFEINVFFITLLCYIYCVHSEVKVIQINVFEIQIQVWQKCLCIGKRGK
jgi:hypothetical protein